VPAPAAFVPGSAGGGPAWVADTGSGDFLGNEFLLWLWHTGEADTDTLKLADGSEATFMIARTLQLDGPRGQSGADAFKSDGRPGCQRRGGRPRPGSCRGRRA
jgi:hypothetical protein